MGELHHNAPLNVVAMVYIMFDRPQLSSASTSAEMVTTVERQSFAATPCTSSEVALAVRGTICALRNEQL